MKNHGKWRIFVIHFGKTDIDCGIWGLPVLVPIDLVVFSGVICGLCIEKMQNTN